MAKSENGGHPFKDRGYGDTENMAAKFTAANAIAAAMADQDLTPEATSQRCHVEAHAIRLIANGAVTGVSYGTLIKILLALGCDITVSITAAEVPGRIRVATSGMTRAIVSEVVRTPGIMSGAPCIKGTRIPALQVLTYLQSENMHEIFDDYPSLPIDAPDAVEKWAEDTFGPAWKTVPPVELGAKLEQE